MLKEFKNPFSTISYRVSFIHHHWKAKHTNKTDGLRGPPGSKRARRHCRGACGSAAHQTTASPHCRQAASPHPSPPSCPGTASHAPAQELLKVTNPAENCLCRCADFLMGRQHQSGQRGGQEKREAVGVHQPAGDEGGGGSQISPSLARSELSAFAPFCQLQTAVQLSQIHRACTDSPQTHLSWLTTCSPPCNVSQLKTNECWSSPIWGRRRREGKEDCKTQEDKL